MRIVRLIRLVRIVKLFAQVEAVRAVVDNNKSTVKKRRSADLTTDGAVTIEEPSKVGTQLAELTTRRVIVLVLFMIIALPLMDSATFTVSATAGETGLAPVHELAALQPRSQTFNDSLVYYATNDLKLLYIHVYGVGDWEVNAMLGGNFTDMSVLGRYRTTEVEVGLATKCFDPSTQLVIPGAECISYACFDTQASARMDAVLNLVKTLFVIVVLGFGVIMLTNDAETLVIEPIERMVKKVMKLAKDPLGTVQQQEVKKENGACV